ncbi:MAG: helix-turn-helix domain-containing protein, partial [Planctomycetota bacterium]
AMQALLAFDWPGNARRLRAVIKRACAITDASRLTIEDLDLTNPLQRTTQADPPESLDDWTLATIERRHIQRVLRHAQGNKSEAARVLGIARTTLDRKLASYDLE